MDCQHSRCFMAICVWLEPSSLPGPKSSTLWLPPSTTYSLIPETTLWRWEILKTHQSEFSPASCEMHLKKPGPCRIMQVSVAKVKQQASMILSCCETGKACLWLLLTSFMWSLRNAQHFWEQQVKTLASESWLGMHAADLNSLSVSLLFFISSLNISVMGETEPVVFLSQPKANWKSKPKQNLHAFPTHNCNIDISYMPTCTNIDIKACFKANTCDFPAC